MVATWSLETANEVYAWSKKAWFRAQEVATPLLERAVAQSAVIYKNLGVAVHDLLEWYRQRGGAQGIGENLWKFLKGETIA